MDSWRDKDEEDEVEISDFNAGGKGEFIFNSFCRFGISNNPF